MLLRWLLAWWKRVTYLRTHSLLRSQFAWCALSHIQTKAHNSFTVFECECQTIERIKGIVCLNGSTSALMQKLSAKSTYHETHGVPHSQFMPTDTNRADANSFLFFPPYSCSFVLVSNALCVRGCVDVELLLAECRKSIVPLRVHVCTVLQATHSGDLVASRINHGAARTVFAGDTTKNMFKCMRSTICFSADAI